MSTTSRKLPTTRQSRKTRRISTTKLIIDVGECDDLEALDLLMDEWMEVDTGIFSDAFPDFLPAIASRLISVAANDTPSDLEITRTDLDLYFIEMALTAEGRNESVPDKLIDAEVVPALVTIGRRAIDVSFDDLRALEVVLMLVNITKLGHPAAVANAGAIPLLLTVACWDTFCAQMALSVLSGIVEHSHALCAQVFSDKNAVGVLVLTMERADMNVEMLRHATSCAVASGFDAPPPCDLTALVEPLFSLLGHADEEVVAIALKAAVPLVCYYDSPENPVLWSGTELILAHIPSTTPLSIEAPRDISR